MVLNACQSAMVDSRAEDAFASVAAALLRAGIRSVWRWPIRCTSAAARNFCRVSINGCSSPATWPKRCGPGGRRCCANRGGCVHGVGFRWKTGWCRWCISSNTDLSFVGQRRVETPPGPALPEEAQDKENPYGFIGRDGALLALERALRRPPAGILIQGLAGVGKTTLAVG